VKTAHSQVLSSDVDEPVEKRLNGKSGGDDLTGRDKLVRNVFTSWGGHLVFVVAGLILPRMIDSQLGQIELGIWDFAWSIVNYFGIAELGIGTSVNRYVAKYRAADDTQGLRASVSSVYFIQLLVSAIIVGLSLAVGWLMPVFFSDRLGAHITTAQYVLVLLGFSLAVEMAFDTFKGVLTGCHRWDVYNIIKSASYALTVVGMIAALLCGGGLVALSAVYLAGTIIGEVARIRLAYIICPQLSIRWKYFSLQQAKAMLHFGLKGVVAMLPNFIISQSAGIFIVVYLGPAALAIFSRPAALIRQLDNIINKFAMVLTPTAGSLQSAGMLEELYDLLFRSTRIGVFLSLPGILFLSILGDPILRLWMGPRYEAGMVLAIMATGSLLTMSQQSVFTILTGMNLHGKVALWSSIATTSVFFAGAAALMFVELNLNNVAAVLVTSFCIGNGIIRPVYSCKKMGIPIAHYLRQVFILPIACNLPFAVCLGVNRILIGEMALASVTLGCMTALLTLGPFYWRHLLPEKRRDDFKARLRKWSARAANAVGI
jgi:O-antigen/teichoic acid export membrane protein